MSTTTQDTRTVAQMKTEARRVFDRACAILGITAKEVFIGYACHATFAKEEHANELAEALRIAGQPVDVHHWDPNVDPDWTENEWQVSW